MKRTLDLVFSVLLLPVIIPLLLVFSIILIFELREFPVFSQERGLSLTKYRFRIFKLKTLRSTDVTSKEALNGQEILLSPLLFSSVPRFAGWLRKTGLDELPQIYNILAGHMSFIGPRPLMLSDLKGIKEKYPHYYLLRNRLNAKPGLSGIWQLFCNREEGVKNLIALDTLYEEMHSLKLDLKILLFTIPVVLTGSNRDSILMNGLLPLKNLLGLNNSTRIYLLKDPVVKMNKEESFEDDYMVTIPGGWWFKNNSYSPVIKENLKIVPLSTGNRKSA